jgi:[ribosomal protein S5]-alanine N-acetyltransferase
MFELDSGEFVGRCGFGPIETGEIEVGYLLHKKFWGKGLASEVLTTLLEWAKQNINADYIIAFAPIEHLASQRVMQKCGMEHYKNDNAKGVACCFYRVRNR